MASRRLTVMIVIVTVLAVAYNLSLRRHRPLNDASQIIKDSIGVLLSAEHRHHFRTAVKAILDVDRERNHRLTKHENDSVALICFWQHLIEDLNARLSPAEQRNSLEMVAREFNVFFQHRVGFSCPPDWLATISEGRLRSDNSLVFDMARLAWSLHTSETRPLLVFPEYSADWGGELSVLGNGGVEGVSAEFVVPPDIVDAIGQSLERDSMNAISAIASENYVWMTIPDLHGFLLMKNRVVCLKRSRRQNICEIQWDQWSRTPVSGHTGRLVTATQIRLFAGQLFLFNCNGDTISIEAYDAETGALRALFLTLPPPVGSGGLQA